MKDLRREDPQVIGPFHLISRLGSGGMGTVYLAAAPGDANEHLALKVIKPDHADNPEFRQRFAREVAAAVRIRHPRTVRVIDFDVTTAEPWLATEYVCGLSLQEHIQASGPLSAADALAFGAGVLDGLAAMHTVGLVHRDLKPSNIMLEPAGPKIIDFGLAYTRDASTLTWSGTPLGTPGYFSPEQAQGLKVTPAADVFSFGALMIFATCGQPPFGSGEYAALMWRVVHEEPDMASVPSDLQGIIRACMAKNPDDRPSLEELGEAFGKCRVAPGKPRRAVQRRRIRRMWAGRPVGRIAAPSWRDRKTGWVLAMAGAAAVVAAPFALNTWTGQRDDGAGSPKKPKASPVRSAAPVPIPVPVTKTGIDPLKVDWTNRTYYMFKEYGSAAGGPGTPIKIKNGQSHNTPWHDVYLTKVLHTQYQGSPITFVVLNYAFKIGSDVHYYSYFDAINCLRPAGRGYQVAGGMNVSTDIQVGSGDVFEPGLETWKVSEEGKLVRRSSQTGTLTTFLFDASCSVEPGTGSNPD